MAIDMTTVKKIMHNNKEVAKIEDGLGNILWQKQSAKVLQSITLSGQTTSLNRGAAFSFGGTVTANYSDGSTADVTSAVTFSGYNMSTAGTYTVTAQYTENSVTVTATYSLTVNPIWSTLWSGSKTITAAGTKISGTSNNFCQTAANTGNSPQIRITYATLSGSARSPSVISYFNNSTSSSPNVSSKPASPVTITLNSAATVYALGVYAQTTFVGSDKVYLVKTNNGTSNCYLSLQGAYTANPSGNTAKLKITKIEQCY